MALRGLSELGPTVDGGNLAPFRFPKVLQLLGCKIFQAYKVVLDFLHPQYPSSRCTRAQISRKVIVWPVYGPNSQEVPTLLGLPRVSQFLFFNRKIPAKDVQTEDQI